VRIPGTRGADKVVAGLHNPEFRINNIVASLLLPGVHSFHPHIPRSQVRKKTIESGSVLFYN
jgi:hypothetical protein